MAGRCRRNRCLYGFQLWPQYRLPGTFAPIADFGLCTEAVQFAQEHNIKTVVGNVLSSGHFLWG